MKEAILICAMLAVFVFGFFVMLKLDRFLESNRRKIDGRADAPVLRIAVESFSLAESVADLLESFSKKEPACQLYLITGNAEEIVSGLAANELDFGFISADHEKDHVLGYDAVLMPLKQGGPAAPMGIPVMPMAAQDGMAKVLWKKEKCTLAKKQFAELLEQYVSSCELASNYT